MLLLVELSFTITSRMELSAVVSHENANVELVPKKTPIGPVEREV